jgi:hypothetical protein
LGIRATLEFVGEGEGGCGAKEFDGRGVAGVQEVAGVRE